ncbi:hypothetical protein JTE90_026602 [Oedothorax gibbosus]|uniref:Uncharacterized protein n=1 Tax=Oedothorax gibbosus TaxID=931172 RepID=A0AAV6V119_9ARAC|nr:hypothetical protein JTE90_026602 [Oedothorax gibbosus]
MLRALAGYFFGGPQQEEQLECETKEVNDWLVVNMPDQPQTNIELEEESNDMELDDIDDVLWCLSNWFSPEVTEKTTNLEDEEDIEPSITQVRFLYDQENEVQNFDILYNNNKENNGDSMVNLPNELDIFMNMAYNLDLRQLNDWPLMPFVETSRCGKNMDQIQLKKITDYLKETLPMSFFVPPTNSKCELLCLYEEGSSKPKELLQRLRERNGKKATKHGDVTCPPVYSKTYVNHRHPSQSPPKTDLLQKIKELEPEQKATQYAMKKNLSRGQINRQNKNYIYDTSTKKNRRKNLQRNPSGANNNRKCCY